MLVLFWDVCVALWVIDGERGIILMSSSQGCYVNFHQNTARKSRIYLTSLRLRGQKQVKLNSLALLGNQSSKMKTVFSTALKTDGHCLALDTPTAVHELPQQS